jgi:hypothetical protein
MVRAHAHSSPGAAGVLHGVRDGCVWIVAQCSAAHSLQQRGHTRVWCPVRMCSPSPRAVSVAMLTAYIYMLLP